MKRSREESFPEKKLTWSDDVVVHSYQPSELLTTHTEMPRVKKHYDLSYSDKSKSQTIIKHYLNSDRHLILIDELGSLVKNNKLDAVMLYTNYQIFKWAIHNSQTTVLEFLAENVAKVKYHMLYNNNFEAYRDLVNIANNNIDLQKHDSNSFQKIVAIILSMDCVNSRYIIPETINHLVHDDNNKNLISKDFTTALKTYEGETYIPLNYNEFDSNQSNHSISLILTDNEDTHATNNDIFDVSCTGDVVVCY